MADQDLAYEIGCNGEKVLVKSIQSAQKVHLKFINKTSRPVDVWWRDFSGRKVHYRRLDAGTEYSQDSFVTHPWECTDVDTKERYFTNEKPFLYPPSNAGGNRVDCIISQQCALTNECGDTCQNKLVKSIESTQSVSLRFINKTSRPVDVWWRDFNGQKVHYARLESGGIYCVESFVTHPWECTDVDTKERYFTNEKPFFYPPSNVGGNRVDCIISQQCDLANECGDTCQNKVVKSIESTQSVSLRFINKTSRPVDVWWRDFNGQKVHYARLESGGIYCVESYVTHPWECTDVDTKERYLTNEKPFFYPPSNAGANRVDCNITADASMESMYR